MPWYNNQSFVSICFQRQKRWRKSEFNLFSKAKALAPSQNEGNSGSGTLETAVLFGLRIEWNDFFLMHGHILFCVLILKFKSYFVLLGNFVFSNTIQDVKNVIFKVVVGQNHIQYSNHDLKTPTLNIFQFLIGSSSSLIMVEDHPVEGSIDVYIYICFDRIIIYHG